MNRKIDFEKMTIKEARELLVKGDISSVDLVKGFLEIIDKKDRDIHALLEVYSDVLDQAKKADERIKKGENKPLLGVPIVLKDNILIEGKNVTSASKILHGYVAPYDATVIRKLKDAGAIFIGRANMDEFAMGSSTENSAFGPTKNPIDLSRVPGGSSGGSVASVSAGMTIVALGSDTGGSIRQPASFCGVVGFKPSYGSVSRHGLMAMGSSLDVIGPIAKTVTDTEIIFDVIKGKDEMDATSIEVNSKKKYENLRVADLSDFIEKIGKGGVDSVVMENYQKGLEHLKTLGYKIIKPKTDLTPLDYSLATYYVVMPAEVSANLSRFDGIRFGFYKEGKNLLEDYKNSRGEGFGKEPRRRIILGTYVLSSGYYDAYYGKAMMVRELLKDTFEKLFKEVDIVTTPTAPTPAFKFGEKTDDPVSMYLADIFTVTANMVGIPAISVPFGFKKEDGHDLPTGFQMMAPYKEDYMLLDIAKKMLREK
jgi:aspartyl-tRNA(Asn)/glutamyl-tRNA(Gln) amidotransferase subunit A